ncbi:hypothetical protein J1N35_043856 [Gossypium stocksii]|uniref:CCHC-type domain-containing protein n=1 Tax=Gossypium stocksii TaxID=47602 RepID=A0A9D3U821_9ROSI|nr:hypothetical protein J1N35_043856 [Gossypium stocksii]
MARSQIKMFLAPEVPISWPEAKHLILVRCYYLLKLIPTGPWVIFGHYLTVQPWTIAFNPNLPYPSLVLTWIRFPSLPSHLYKKQILMEIEGLIGKVSKLNFNLDGKAKGRYARMVVFVNLGRPLVSKILINRNPQRIEYDNLPIVCFKCGFYGHFKENCSSMVQPSKVIENGESSANIAATSRPWMLVEWRSKHGTSERVKKGNNLKKREFLGSKFQSLAYSEVVSSEEGNPKIPQSDLKKERKAPIIISKNYPQTGRKHINKVFKKSNLGLLVDKPQKSQPALLGA